MAHTRLVVHREIYTDLQELFKWNIALTKSTYYHTEIYSASHDSKTMFRITNELMCCQNMTMHPFPWLSSSLYTSWTRSLTHVHCWQCIYWSLILLMKSVLLSPCVTSS